MDKKKVIDKLREDEHYYGDFGKKYISNSDIATLLKNPLALGQPSKPSAAFLVGGYFHTAILEPHEVDNIELLSDKVLSNKVCYDLIRGKNVEYETPGIAEIEGNMWKGKADIVNHDEKLVIDLKTTNDINTFRNSAWKYNYDSQAYIYNKLFGYELIFIVIDKNTHQIGLYDCSTEFLDRGLDKVQRATEAYNLFYKTENFDASQYFINKTL